MNPFISSFCVLCDATVQRKISLCEACQVDLPVITHGCKVCGIPLDKAENICGQCLKSLPVYDYNISVYHYETPIDYLITRLKFNQQLTYASILGFLLKEYVLKSQVREMPEVLLPVPLHNKRLVKRGFNQSLEIAKVVSKAFNIPIDYKLLKKTKSTQAQSELDLKHRKQNIKGCFELEKVPDYQHVVIIDDVVTTGATSNELARVLKKSGIKTVGVWSIARAELHGK